MEESLYITKSSSKEGGNEHYYNIELNPNHSIFKGHFPDQPVLPGVFQIKIVTELFEQVFDSRLSLEKVTNVKFLKMIDPRDSKFLDVHLKTIEHANGVARISSTIENKNGVCFKFKGVYKEMH